MPHSLLWCQREIWSTICFHVLDAKKMMLCCLLYQDTHFVQEQKAQLQGCQQQYTEYHANVWQCCPSIKLQADCACKTGEERKLVFPTNFCHLDFSLIWFTSRCSQLYLLFSNNLHNDSVWWIGTDVQGSNCGLFYVTTLYVGLTRVWFHPRCLIYTYSAV